MSYLNAIKAAKIVRDAGGCIVGRTKLQKVAYLLCLSGLERGLSFSYKHYGPFSEELADGARNAKLLGLLLETEHQASWGATYSIYRSLGESEAGGPDARRTLAELASAADSIELELAATAAFLANEGHRDPWVETERRKPEKAEGRLEGAKVLYRRLQAVQTPERLPEI